MVLPKFLLHIIAGESPPDEIGVTDMKDIHCSSSLESGINENDVFGPGEQRISTRTLRQPYPIQEVYGSYPVIRSGDQSCHDHGYPPL
jgi:hypothetical protein